MKVFIGKVIYKKDDKTAKVAVDRVVAHPVYKKRYTRTKNYAVHDEMSSSVEDTVKFVASKPYSKTKKWKIVEIVGKKNNEKKKDANSKKQTSEKKKTKKGGKSQ